MKQQRIDGVLVKNIPTGTHISFEDASIGNYFGHLITSNRRIKALIRKNHRQSMPMSTDRSCCVLVETFSEHANGANKTLQTREKKRMR